jgi:L-fuconolactonase
MSAAQPLPVIDAHHHLWDVSVRPQPWLDSAAELAPLRRAFSIADLRPLAADAGVTGTVVVQTVTDLAETTELLELVEAEPLVTAVVGWADLAAPDVADVLAWVHEQPGGGALAGIRHPLLTEPDPLWLERPDVQHGLAAVAAAGLTFDLVLQPAVLPAAVLAAASQPGLTFVLDHLGNVDAGPAVDKAWAAQLAAFAALPNTVGKLSGILGDIVRTAGQADIAASAARLRPYVDIALEQFGPRRLMFGSDWPVCTLSAGYGEVAGVARALIAGLSEAEQAAILSDTARSVYRIGVAGPSTAPGM